MGEFASTNFSNIFKCLYFPLRRNPPQRGVFEGVGLFGAQLGIFVDAACEQVLHQAGFDALLFGNQGFGLLYRKVHGREDFSDLGLLTP